MSRGLSLSLSLPCHHQDMSKDVLLFYVILERTKGRSKALVRTTRPGTGDDRGFEGDLVRLLVPENTEDL